MNKQKKPEMMKAPGLYGIPFDIRISEIEKPVIDDDSRRPMVFTLTVNTSEHLL